MSSKDTKTQQLKQAQVEDIVKLSSSPEANNGNVVSRYILLHVSIKQIKLQIFRLSPSYAISLAISLACDLHVS